MYPIPIITLHEAIARLRKWLSHHSSSTLQGYEALFRKLFREQDANPELTGLEIVSSFYEKHLQIPAFLRPKTTYKIKQAGILLRLVSLLLGQDISLKCRFCSSLAPEWYSGFMEEYSKWMILTDKCQSTIKTRTWRMKYFFAFMVKHGIHRIQELSLPFFFDFIGMLNDAGYSSQFKHNILYTVRDFLKCPYVQEKLTCNPMPLLSNMHTKKHERLPSFYKADEILKILKVIDKNSIKGKLTYAVILLACVYGLRSIDIRELKFDSLKWDTNRIVLIQKKTTNYLELPLIPEVKWALLDYIKNARPHVNDPHVFIRTRIPQIPYGKEDHFAHLIVQCFKAAGIDISSRHHGLHSLRHSLATMLTEMEVPLNKVATILGHSSVNATLQYVWSDIQHLAIAAEEVTPYEK